jgi:hypothetical protein
MFATIDRPVAIRQELSAGNNFDGSAPESGGLPLVPTFDHDTFVHTVGDKGGLFDPWDTTRYTFPKRDSLILAGMELKLGGQTTWKLELVDAFGTVTQVYNGTTETTVVKGAWDIPAGLIITWGSKLKLTTVGASTAMVATLKLGPNDLALAADGS